MSNAGAVADRLDGPDFIVGMHNADEDCARRDRLAKVARVNAAHAVDRQVRYPRAQPFEKPARLDDRGVLDAGGNDVIALAAQGEKYAFEGQVIGLTAAARKNNLIVVAAEKCCDLAASSFDGGLCADRGPCWLDGLP